MGPPGAGRRTQTLCLAGCLGVAPIHGADLETADRIRSAVVAGVDHGGFVLSGYPRTLAEAMELDELLGARGTPLDAVIVLNVSQNLRLYRLARDESPGAAGDDANRRRVCEHQHEYTNSTVPVLDRYRSIGVLDVVDGVGSVAAVTLRIAASLHAQRYGRSFPQAVNG
jgi:adenylate kinase